MIRGQYDKIEHLKVHSTSSIQPQVVPLLLKEGIIFGFVLRTSKNRPDYLYSSKLHVRDEYIVNPVQ